MNKQTATALVIGLIIGATGTLGITAANKDSKANTTAQIVTSTTDHNAQATAKLKDLKGDDFDKAFIEEMIMHHQGAIDMAKLAGTNANHAEIKQLGQDIMSAQSNEIDMMQNWQAEWGYRATPQSHETSH